MSTNLEETARAAFARAFGAEPIAIGQAPGRVELLGNHTDYHDGLVLAAAIDRSTVVVGRPTTGREARVHSANLGELDVFEIDAMEPGDSDTWGRYVRGVTWAIQQDHGPIPTGFQAALAGDVPIGAGLSSSASLQAAFALFLARIESFPWSEGFDEPARMALAKTLRKSENQFVGVASGLLDQFSSLFGRADHAFVLDCRDLTYELLPMGTPAPSIVVCDSRTSRKLADGMYNRRRAEGERVVDHFRRLRGQDQVGTLRDVTLGDLHAEWDKLDPVGRLRARHVLTENDRVVQGARALRSGDLTRFGALMSASHASSRDDFQNSSPALDALIETAEESPGFLGGKLSGAGWAGCTVNLVRPDFASSFAESIRGGYERRTGLIAGVHICQAADGGSARTLG